MRKMLVIIVALLATAATATEDVETNKTWAQAATSYACDMLHAARNELRCSKDIVPPIIVISYITNDHYYNATGTLRGITYPNEPYIFVRRDMDVEESRDTALHELTHYVLFQIAPLMGRCEHEELARLVAGQDDDTSWRDFYNCGKETTDDNGTNTTAGS